MSIRFENRAAQRIDTKGETIEHREAGIGTANAGTSALQNIVDTAEILTDVCFRQLSMAPLSSCWRFEIPRRAGESVQNMTAQRVLGGQPRMVEIVAGLVCHA